MKNLKPTTIYLILLIVLISCKKETKLVNSHIIEKEEVEVLSPPIPVADIKFTNFKIDANKDTVINHNSGAIIKVPKNAFINSNGDVITNNVELKFRSFLNPLETYLAGIPMNYSVNGEDKVFESAGMFEIIANSKGEKLFVNPESKIKVTINSFNEDNQFNTYDLEEESGVWTETGKDNLIVESKEDALKNLPKLPTPPKRAGKFAFELENELYKDSEISNYKNVWFTPIDGKECGFDAKDIKVKDLKNGTFEVTFIPWIETEGLKTKCICYLSFKDNAEYSKALQDYQKKYAGLIAKEKKLREEIENEWAEYESKLKDYKIFLAKDEIEKLKGQKKILRTLEVNNFGFVNVDKPIDYPQGATIKAKFVDANGKKISLKQVVLIEIGRNALYRYKKEIKFNPNNDNLLWGVTKEGKLAYFTNENFKSLESTYGKVTLKMNVHPTILKSYDEIVKVLFSK